MTLILGQTEIRSRKNSSRTVWEYCGVVTKHKEYLNSTRWRNEMGKSKPSRPFQSQMADKKSE